MEVQKRGLAWMVAVTLAIGALSARAEAGDKPPLRQLSAAQAAALAGQACPVLTTGKHKLGRGWSYTLYACEYEFGPASMDLKLKARLRKDNQSLPDFSTTGTVKARGEVKFELSILPPRACLGRLAITGVNFHNVQNDLEQAVRAAVNEQLARAFCSPL